MNKCYQCKKIQYIAAALLGAAALSGCGDSSEDEKELAAFSASVSSFNDYIQGVDEQINSLDVTRQESAGELLVILDDMNAKFAEFSLIQAPDQYESVPGLAKRASEDMALAVSYYHTAYESETFDANYADAAYQCYSNSMKAVKYIGFLLMGEDIPEDDNVTVYEIPNDEHILDRWLSGGDEDAGDSETASE
ncbi:MAG: hypothetical protein K2P39_14505 [Lachnospiraceae bacterium]|nr:hypothetical protein [Lachnospiraceae bacterium]